MFDGGAPLGISPSQPWPDFASDLRPPDHPGERVISNLKRFAGGKICCFSCMGGVRKSKLKPSLNTRLKVWVDLKRDQIQW